MKRVKWCVLALAATMLASQLASAPTAPAVVILVRHAEKAATPAADPDLTAAGRLRAAELARVVGTWRAAGGSVRALFATEFKRTQQTLVPLATATGVAVTKVNAADTAGLVKGILAINGGLVVVAGHSDTVPAVIQALGGPSGITIAETEFDRLFAMTAAGNHPVLVAMRYGKS